MTVEITAEIKGRGIVAGGILLTADPIAGEEVIIEADGRPPLKAHLSAVEMGVTRPKIGILLGHMGQDDVPIGARIRPVDQ